MTLKAKAQNGIVRAGDSGPTNFLGDYGMKGRVGCCDWGVLSDRSTMER